MWKQCSEGQTHSYNAGNSTNSCSGNATKMTWKTALEIVNNYTFNSKNDWRLPNVEELRSLAALNNSKKKDPAINSNIFPNTSTNVFASSSPYFTSNTQALWVISFQLGDAVSIARGFPLYNVRLVRNVQ